MKILTNCSILGLFLILTACSQISSNEVDASAIYGELSLNRDEGSSQAKASATFFVGGPTGTIVRMESPASILINGKTANEVTEPIINITSYESPVSTNASLVYTDKEGKSYTNSLFMPGSLSLSLTSNTVFKSQGFSLNYTSTSNFVSGEKLEVTLSNSSYSQFVNAELVTGVNSGSAIIASSALTNFAPGTLTIKICRESSPAAQSPYPKGTSVMIKSCSHQTTANLQP